MRLQTSRSSFAREAIQDDRLCLVSPYEPESRFEAWKAKESKVGEGVPAAWGDWEARAINWETITAMALVESGADIIVLRHPESVARVKSAIEELIAA